MTTWTTMARQRADHLDTELDLLEQEKPKVDPVQIDELHKRVRKVRHDHLGQSGSPSPGAAAAWWRGNQVNDAWFELHEIETDIERIRPDLDLVLTKARDHVHRELPKRQYRELTQRVASAPTEEGKRVMALDLLDLSHRATEARHEGERQRQRGVLGIAAVMFAVAVLTVVLQAFSSDPFVQPPSEGVAVSARFLLGLVMLFGALGGLVSSLFSLYVGGTKFPNTVWFDPRPMLTVAKTVIGLWTAVIGILAVGSGLLVGVYTSLASALLLAFLFGYGQQAVTGFLDRKVVEMTKEPEE